MIGKKMYNFLKDYRHFIMVDSFKNPFTAFYVLDDIKGIVVDVNSKMIILSKDDDFIK
jgi:hypothetical protein